MKSEEQVLEQILGFANSDNRVKAVMLNGSRLNVNAPKDIMQDYDVVFFIDDFENMSYKTDQSWIRQFGELVILQQNDFDDGTYIFLMQFKDGVRIDLSFNDIKKVNTIIKSDSLSKILLDKDNISDKLPEPDDVIYYVSKPTEIEWNELINEIWWIQTYVAKGIWRDELPIVKYMYDVIFIDGIRTLLSWKIGMEHNWKINVGKCGKWFKYLLSEDLYNEFVSLYAGADYDEIWQKLSRSGVLIRRVGTELGKEIGYTYPIQDDINVSEYINKIKALPKDATSFDD